jgi:hypothetical protein
MKNKTPARWKNKTLKQVKKKQNLAMTPLWIKLIENETKRA